MSEEKKMTEEKKMIEEKKLYEEKKVADPFIAGFYESMAKTNTEKITKEIMEDLSEDSDDNDDKHRSIAPGGQAILSSESQPLSKVMLTL
jgi:ferritin-like protein